MSADTIYELTCPHCGKKYQYPSEMGNPADNKAVLACERCGLEEFICSYYRINCVMSANSTNKEFVPREMKNVYKKNVKPQDKDVINADKYKTIVADGPIVQPEEELLTAIDLNDDPHIFNNPPTLVNLIDNEEIQLHVGVQIVGRLAPEEGPDIGFNNVDKTFSRRHLKIITVETGNGKFVNTVQNEQNKNRTYLDEQELMQGAIWKIAKNMKLRVGKNEIIIKDLPRSKNE